MSWLELTLIYLSAAVIGVSACRWLKLPPVLGYLLVGVAIEPHTFGWTFGQDASSIRQLGEYGVVFLMFVVGLEFDLDRLRAMRRHVFGLGLAQVLSTLALLALAAWVVGRYVPAGWGISWQAMLALAGSLAMSSTAIVVKMMRERGELQTEYGQRTLGVLLLQDLAVVPLLVLIPALGSTSSHLLADLGQAAFKAVLIIVVLIWGGQHLMRGWLTFVARRKSQELFTLNLLLMTLGLAWLTLQAGLSLALGAFICGVLIAETEFRIQVAAEIRPFHDVLLGLFFITIGMLMDLRQMFAQWPLVLLLLVGGLVFKVSLITGLARLFGASGGVALRTGLYLAQVGEFGFVLLTLASHEGLIAHPLFHPVLAAMVLSMLLTPFIIMSSERLVMRFVASEWLHQSLRTTRIATETIGLEQHVLICGFGRSGQATAQGLHGEGLTSFGVDIDPDRVHRARQAGWTAVYGDASKIQTLTAAGLARASAVLITYLDLPTVYRTLQTIRSHTPQTAIIVRTRDERHHAALKAAGATEVIAEAAEGALILTAHALVLMGDNPERVRQLMDEQHEQRYPLLHGAPQASRPAPTPQAATDTPQPHAAVQPEHQTPNAIHANPTDS